MAVRIALVPSLLLFLNASVSLGADIRTYRFTGDASAYRSSCGECGAPPYTTRAKIEGTFVVELDVDAGTGALLSLDAHLTEVEGLFGDQWQPFGPDRAFLGPQPWYDYYRPPFSGELVPAEYRPLGPASLTNEHRHQFIGVPLSQIPNPLISWLFNEVGWEPAPASSSILVASNFNIYFEGNEALFSYNIPIIDAVEWIGAARAILVPEPIAMMMVSIAIVSLLVCCRRR